MIENATAIVVFFVHTHSSSSCSDEGQRMEGESTMSPISIKSNWSSSEIVRGGAELG